MLNNKRIRERLEFEMNLNLNQYKSIQNKHQILLDLEKRISTFDFNIYKYKIEKTLISNIEQWGNILSKIEAVPKLDALLFEYDTTWWKSRQAHAYGIYDWKSYKLSEEEVDLDLQYEILEELEHLPSFLLEFYDSFSFLDDDDEIEKKYVLEDNEYWDLKGFDELHDFLYFKGCIAIHDVLIKLQKKGLFDQFNFRHQAMILIGEHDMGERCLLIV
ncbi:MULTISPECIES: hypothetical protein [unclassified Tenacibaculum]|uniref:hypothetical protein n=1 Tax=unclassified Tenacibaculum TaxID=2635139 RepID=UPI001F3907D4|nr:MULTISPECIES: hypothetical protein [unclassified Tenacibaculum]MCF2875712.1 hypothetical protein [Tenacibaculum sp. Cn5-1]MCF2935788.1 hypothetical protein [Tenacibaculum sp. Cn5-34]MCG7512348.1 hypothetical protein [Tenacibaculum sp. Cn5-46]